MKVPLNLYVEYDVKLELQKLADKHSDGNISKYVSELIKKEETPSITRTKTDILGSESVRQVFNYFNEQVGKLFKPENKLRLLTDERKRHIEKLLKGFSVDEIKKGINGFLAARKDNTELKENYLDFRYLVKNFESYLAKGVSNQSSIRRELTEEEKKVAQEKSDRMYQQFLQREKEQANG